MFSISKISKNFNLKSLNLHRQNLQLSFQKRLLTSASNNCKSDDKANKPVAEKEIDEINKNDSVQESSSTKSKNQQNIDDILSLFSSEPPPSSSSFLSTKQEPPSGKEGIDHFLSNFQSKSSYSSSFPTSSSPYRSSSPNSDVAKLLSDFLVPSEEIYILHIHASYNNTLVTLTNSRGDILLTKSGGSVGFKKAQRGGYEAAHQTAAGVIQKIKEKGLNVKNVEICIKGFGPGRDAAFKALANVENQWNVKRITDTTPLPFNGCRPRKARRL
ncbi:8205_t:CDS:1 [Funneliformis geosporum]|uniref:8205_t:CDS:1 n=1 Tax=Funneliformis geosporum TaxID=1117311 RepID=A0A9W4SUB9_9GLOM|nr:8205_t:CDS:1 [Funneliformis geosporum]